MLKLIKEASCFLQEPRDYLIPLTEEDLPTNFADPDKSTVEQLMLQMQLFDEERWLRLVAFSDQNQIKRTSTSIPLTSTFCLLLDIYEAANNLAIDSSSASTSRINAYLFLRSQNKTLASLSSFLSFIDFTSQLKNLEAFAITIMDPHFPTNVLTLVSEETRQHAVDHFINLAIWAKENPNTEALKVFLQYFAYLKNPVITMSIIKYGFNGTCAWEDIYDIFSTIPAPLLDNNLFNVFFLNQMLNNPIESEIKAIDDALAPFGDESIIELQNDTIANKIFTVFIAPALKAHPQHLRYAGQKITSEQPRLLNAFFQLISNIVFNSEGLYFAASEPYYRLSILAHQIVENNAALASESISRAAKTAVTTMTKAGLVYGKMAKTPFLSAILAQLITHDHFESQEGVPFLWHLYIDTYLSQQERLLVPEEKRYSYEKMKEVYKWLKTVIFDTPDAPETKSLKEALSRDQALQLFGILNSEKPADQGINNNFDCINFVISSEKYRNSSAAAISSFSSPPQAIECLRSEVNKLSKILNERVILDRRSSGMGSYLQETIKSFSKGDDLNGKIAKIYVLSWFLERLLKEAEFKSEEPSVPIIWDLYVSAYLEVKEKYLCETITVEEKQFSPQKIEQVNSWLKNVILDSTSASETVALKSVPIDVRITVFNFRGSLIDPETLSSNRTSLLSYMWKPQAAEHKDSQPMSLNKIK